MTTFIEDVFLSTTLSVPNTLLEWCTTTTLADSCVFQGANMTPNNFKYSLHFGLIIVIMMAKFVTCKSLSTTSSINNLLEDTERYSTGDNLDEDYITVTEDSDETGNIISSDKYIDPDISEEMNEVEINRSKVKYQTRDIYQSEAHKMKDHRMKTTFHKNYRLEQNTFLFDDIMNDTEDQNMVSKTSVKNENGSQLFLPQGIHVPKYMLDLYNSYEVKSPITSDSVKSFININKGKLLL